MDHEVRGVRPRPGRRRPADR